MYVICVPELFAIPYCGDVDIANDKVPPPLSSFVVGSNARLCANFTEYVSSVAIGGMFVAIPTAMPTVPFKRSCGSFAGSTALVRGAELSL